MDSILQDLPFATMYIDDVLVFSQTKCTPVFQCLQGAVEVNATLDCQKCVTYLGHISDYNEMHPDPCKISCVQDWPTGPNPHQCCYIHLNNF